MVPGYALQLLFSKNCKIARNSSTTEAKEKISADAESLNFLIYF
jgi:hypothetical protein